MTNRFSRWRGNLRVFSLVTDARSTLSQLSPSCFFPHFLPLLLLPSPLIQCYSAGGEWKAAQPVLGSGKGCIGSQVSEQDGTEIHSLRSYVVMRSHSWDIWRTPCKYFCRINSTCDNFIASICVDSHKLTISLE